MEENQPDSSTKAPKKFSKVNRNILLGSLFLLSGTFSIALLTKQHLTNASVNFLMALSALSMLGIAVCAFITAWRLLHNLRHSSITSCNIYKTSFTQGLLIIFWLTLIAAAILLPNALGVFHRGNWDGYVFLAEWVFLGILSLPLFITSFIVEISALLKKRRKASAAKESENSAPYKLHPIMYCSFILKILFIITLIPCIIEELR